jgi:hypothetical protein
VDTRPLLANSLINYLKKRFIPLEVAHQYCEEVDFCSIQNPIQPSVLKIIPAAATE